MITGPRFILDFQSKLVTPPSDLVIPLGGELPFFFQFTGTGDDGSTGDINPTLTSLMLTLKEYFSGDVVLQASGALISGSSPVQWVVPVSMTGDLLTGVTNDNGTGNLIAEVKWVMANPFSSHLGSSTITTRSQTFQLPYSITG